MIQPSFTILLSTQCSCQVWKSSSAPCPEGLCAGPCSGKGMLGCSAWGAVEFVSFSHPQPFLSCQKAFTLVDKLLFQPRAALVPSARGAVSACTCRLCLWIAFPIRSNCFRDPARKMTQFLSYCSRIMLVGEVINHSHLLDYLCICINLSWAYEKSERDSCCTIK